MSASPLQRSPLPPRLSMDEYVDFVEAAILAGNPVMARQQKKIEERIRLPFCLSRDATDKHAAPRFALHGKYPRDP